MISGGRIRGVGVRPRQKLMIPAAAGARAILPHAVADFPGFTGGKEGRKSKKAGRAGQGGWCVPC